MPKAKPRKKSVARSRKKARHPREVTIYGTPVIVPDIPPLLMMKGDSGKVILEVRGMYHPAYNDHRITRDVINPWVMQVFAAIAHTHWDLRGSHEHVGVDVCTCKPGCPGCVEEKDWSIQACNWALVYHSSVAEAGELMAPLWRS